MHDIVFMFSMQTVSILEISYVYLSIYVTFRSDNLSILIFMYTEVLRNYI